MGMTIDEMIKNLKEQMEELGADYINTSLFLKGGYQFNCSLHKIGETEDEEA